MRSHWEALRSGLMRSIESGESVAAFQTIREGTRLSSFPEPAAVVTYLVGPVGDCEAKDRILEQLVLTLKAEQATPVVTSILVLGLWPGLDAAFNRRARLFRHQEADLAAELLQRIIAEARALDLTRVARIAATLVRNTERRVLQARLRETAVADCRQDLSACVGDVSSAVSSASTLSSTPTTGRSDVASVEVLRAWLGDVVGRDADLVVEIVLLERTPTELAHLIGLPPETVRKRLQRALARARRAMERRNFSVTGSAETRVCPAMSTQREDRTPPATEELLRLPGLFRRCEFEQVLNGSDEFRVEAAGSTSDGTKLFAVYYREQPRARGGAR